MELSNEKNLIDYPKPVFINETEIILKQMKNNIGQICKKDGLKATCFFCKIPLGNDKTLPVLITNNYVIDEKYLQKEEKILIKINNGKKIDIKYISLKDKFKYTNKKYDVTIIEMKQKDNISDFLEFDENILNDTIGYIGNSVYILHFPNLLEEGKSAVSYGIIKKIFDKKEYDFIHYCSTHYGSSGSPILNLSNNKIIGIHKQASKTEEFNIGSFLYYPLKEFISFYNQKKYIYNLKTFSDKFNKLYLKLYNKGLINDIIQIKKGDFMGYSQENSYYSGDDKVIAYKLKCSNKKKPNDWQNWVSAWHGTNSSNLESIVENGLKIPETKIKDKETLIMKNKNYIKLKNNVFGIKNWDNAIFASKNIHYALAYSDLYDYDKEKGECFSWKALVEVKIKPGGFTKYKSEFVIDYYLDHTFSKNYEDDIYRIEDENDIIVTSITLIKYYDCLK